MIRMVKITTQAIAISLLAASLTAIPAVATQPSTAEELPADSYATRSAVEQDGWHFLLAPRSAVSWTFSGEPADPRPGRHHLHLDALVPDAIDGGVGFGAPATLRLSSGGVSAEIRIPLRDPFRSVTVPSADRALGHRAYASVAIPEAVSEAFEETGTLTVTYVVGSQCDYHVAVRQDSLRLVRGG